MARMVFCGKSEYLRKISPSRESEKSGSTLNRTSRAEQLKYFRTNTGQAILSIRKRTQQTVEQVDVPVRYLQQAVRIHAQEIRREGMGRRSHLLCVREREIPLQIVRGQAFVEMRHLVADTHRTGIVLHLRALQRAYGQSRKKQAQRMDIPLVLLHDERTAEFQGTGQQRSRLFTVPDQGGRIESGHAALFFHDLRAETQPIGPGDLAIRDMPKDHLLIIGVIGIRIIGLSGSFTYCAEGLFPEPVEFLHRFGSILRPEQIGPVVPHLEQHLVRESLDLGPDHIGRDGRRQGFLGSGVSLDRSGNALRLQRITAVPKVFSEGRDVEPGDLVGRNGLADPDLHRRSTLVEDLMDEPDGPEARMDPAQQMEHPGIAAVEIDGDDRKTGLLHQLDDVFRPGNVLDDLPLSECRPVLSFLPRGHLAGREKTQRLSVCDVAEGRPDAGNAARSAG